MSIITDDRSTEAPPLPLLKRLYQRGYSPGERLAINLVLVMLISGCVGFMMSRSDPRLIHGAFSLANWLDIGVGSGLFIVRRWLPWPSLIGVTCLGLAAMVLRLPGVSIFYMVFCLYGVVAVSSQRVGIALGALYLALVVAAAFIGGGSRNNPTSNVVFGVAAITLVGWLAGENTRAGRIYSRYRLEREAAEAAAAEAERAERTRRTIADERVTIARELHDIVAHSMSVVAVRSGVARMVLDSRPEEAAEALAIIETTARQSLAEMRMMVSVLRGSSAGVTAELGPLPGLRDLDRLISQLAAAGVEVELAVDGTARPLAAAADLTAYRIVQEALTNVVRHAAPTSATVRLAYGADELEIEVADLGSGQNGHARAPLSGRDAGHGLVGMRERAAMFGGMLEAGPAEHGFRIHTRLRIDG